MTRRRPTRTASALASRKATPSPRSIALAFAIVQATPPGVASRDYVLQLRAHLKPGRQAFTERERGQYLDINAYLQDKLDASEQKCRELEQKVASLERSIHCLGHLSQDDPDVTMTDASGSKKKGATTTKKQLKKSRVRSVKPHTAEETLEEDLELFETLGKHGATVAQHYWTSQKVLRRNQGNVEELCDSVVGMTNALGCIFPIIAKSHDRLAIRTVHRPSLDHIGKDKSELSCLMTACARAWSLILVALDKLEEDTPGSRLPGFIIFECVKLASSALDAIRLAARQTAWKKGSRPGSESESVGARNIAHLLSTFVGFLSKDNANHHRLFDGIAYVLLERVGDQLYFCTFGCVRGATMEERILPPPEPTDPHEITRKATEDAAIRLEVKALVIILERVMGVAPLHLNEQAAKKNRAALARTVSMKNTISTKIKLSSLAQERLQKTLIACAFDTKSHNDFMDILTKPVNMGPPPRAPHVKDENVPEWYQTQVWNLVGWEILEKDEKWME